MTPGITTLTKIDDLPHLVGLILLIGPPASGKSTFARKLLAQQHLDDSAYISNDHIAKQLFGVTTDRGDKDGEIFAEQDRRIEAKLASHDVAIVDATNVKPEARRRLVAIAQQYNSPVYAFCFWRDKATLLKQNQGRDVVVPENMVLEYASLMEQVTADTLLNEGIDLIFDVPPGIA